MAETPSVSVVIPAYNREASIGAAIASVLRQTLPPTELVVVDDGSADGTAAAVAAIPDPRIRLVRQDNGGSSAARNRGIAEARHDWIAFQDSDDEWLPQKLESQFEALARVPDAIAAYCGMAILGQLDGADQPGSRQQLRYHPGPEWPTVEGDLLAPSLRTNLISTQTLLARTEILKAEAGFDTRFKAVEDWDLAIRLARRGPIAFVDRPLVIQSFSPNSLTRDVLKRVDGWILLESKHSDLFAADPEAHVQHLVRISSGLRQLGNHRQSLAFLRKALAINPWSARVQLRLLASSARLAASAGRPAPNHMPT